MNPSDQMAVPGMETCERGLGPAAKPAVIAGYGVVRDNLLLHIFLKDPAQSGRPGRSGPVALSHSILSYTIISHLPHSTTPSGHPLNSRRLSEATRIVTETITIIKNIYRTGRVDESPHCVPALPSAAFSRKEGGLRKAASRRRDFELHSGGKGRSPRLKRVGIPSRSIFL